MTGFRTVGGAVGVPVSCLAPDGVTWRTLGAYARRVNLVQNPSFRSSNTTSIVRQNLAVNPRATLGNGWRANNNTQHTMTYDATFGRSGNTSAMSTPTANVIGLGRSLGSIYNTGGDVLPSAAPGVIYTCSTYVAHNATVNGEADCTWQFLDNANTVLSSGIGPMTTGIPGDKTWTRVSVVTPAAPAGTTKIRLIVIVRTQAGTRNVAAGENCWFTDCLIEVAGGVLPYFDGAFSPDPETGWTYGWGSTPHASISSWTAPTRSSGNMSAYNSNKGGNVPSGAYRVIQVGPTNASLWMFQFTAENTTTDGDYFSARWQARWVSGSAVSLSPRLGFYGAAFQSYAGTGANVSLPADGSWVDLVVPAQNAPIAGGGAISVRLMCYSNGPTSPGTTIEFRRVLVEKSTVPVAAANVGAYFDGDTAADADYIYSWQGTANASPSIQTP